MGVRTGSGVIRVLVADDHPMMLDSIASRIASDPQLTVVATASDGVDLVAQFARHLPDVVLCDIKMPKRSGVQALRAIRELDPDAKVIILSAYEDESLVTSAIEAGAAGYLPKTVRGGDMVGYLHAIAMGDANVGRDAAEPNLAGTPGSMSTSRSALALSQREREVLALVSRGFTNGEVSQRLFLSPETVKTHLRSIYRKLDVGHRAAAVRVGIERGFV
jgi:DNA-binding NarL/FixJ family response regulator